MALDKLRAALAAIARTLDNRVAIVRIVVDREGRELRRIYRGSFQPSHKETNHE